MTLRLARTSLAAIAVLALTALAVAQQTQKPPEMTPEQKAEMEAYMKAGTPGAPHKVLASTAGSYDLKIKHWQQPGAPAMEETGTATRAVALDGRVLVEEFKSSMMGMPYTGHGMTGFDNVTGKYWSTWSDSMSTGLMVSEGTCDDQGKACTFTGTLERRDQEGPGHGANDHSPDRARRPRSSSCTDPPRTTRSSR